jgi:hypothetical protein
MKLTSLETKTSLKKTNELIKVTITLVLLDKFGKLFSVNDKVETANLRETELLLGHARFVDLPFG